MKKKRKKPAEYNGFILLESWVSQSPHCFKGLSLLFRDYIGISINILKCGLE